MAPRNFRKKENLDPNCPVANAFKLYAIELDNKHDRHERIVKLSRDITIESKRVIFLLHSIDSRKDRLKIIGEAEERLKKLVEVNFRAIASELKNQDVFQFRNAYSAGLQEFIEAFTFMEYLKSEEPDCTTIVVSDWKALQKNMQYTSIKNVEENESDDNATQLVDPEKFQFHIDPTEYILGLSDLTGELMRRCINSLGSGQTETCLVTCNVLQQFYTGYISLNCPRARELWRKIVTMRQSVLKAENVCYNVKVRGGEAAKWGAVFEQKVTDDVDEGFY